MRILFLHRNFPAQFRHLAAHFAQSPENQVAFITARQDRALPGVLKAAYTLPAKISTRPHRYLVPLENSLRHGQAAINAALGLKKRGFTPDLIYGHTWGQGMFMKDVFPDARLIAYCEWFYRARGSDCDFNNETAPTLETATRIRLKNANILIELYSCDLGICPTNWQLQQFPLEFHPKIRVIHDGIDTDFFQPGNSTGLKLPEIGLDLPDATEIVTYVSRGLEPYRGFPQFMEAAALILARRPKCHILVVGEDQVFYGRPRPDGKTYKQALLAQWNPDPTRMHFTGHLPYAAYLKILQASAAHVYLTYPFVLSWSLLEAMAAGCLILASNTPPVTEVIQDGDNGLLFDFFNPTEIALRMDEALQHPDRMEPLRTRARQTILKRYALHKLLPEQIRLIKNCSTNINPPVHRSS